MIATDTSLLQPARLNCQGRPGYADTMFSSGQRRPGTPTLVLVLLALVAGAALYLRVWSLDYDKIHPDDPKQIAAAREFVKGDYLYGLDQKNKYIRGYPYFAMHLIEWTYDVYEQVLSHVAPGTPPPREALAEPDFDIFLRRIGLMLNCFYEMIALGLVFLVGRRIFDPWVGLAAAAVFAVSSLHIQTTHMIGADLPQSLFMFGVFFFCARLRDRERLPDWLGAGICAGLAAATKYSGLLSLLAPALVFVELRQRAGWRGAFSPRRIAGPLVVITAFVAAFALATPSILLAPKAGIAAIQSVLHTAGNFRIVEGYEGRRLAFVMSLWYSHLNNFLRFFEPLPGWLTLISLGVFIARRRLRESILWIYPLVLFAVAAYGFPVGVAYHYLSVLSPLTWVIGFAAVEGCRALKKPWLQVPAVVLLGGWALVAAASDTSVFGLPTATNLAERWFTDCAAPARFTLVSPQDSRKQNYPRMLGIDFEDFSSSARAERAQEAAEMPAVVANFDFEKRTPTLNHIRNRPHRIRWSDGQSHDVELFPPPRRAAGESEEVIFPANLLLSRSAALMALAPAQTVTRRIRREEGASSWLLYAHYPARAAGRDKVRLRLEHHGRWRTLWVDKGGDFLVDLDLRRTDVLYNGFFSTIRLRSNEPVLVWLVSPRERGWFLLMMERWQDLEAWERTQAGWKSEARHAIAVRHLGGGGADSKGASACEAALTGFRTGDPAELFKAWTGGIDLGIFADPRPVVAMERFAVKAADKELTPPQLPPGSRLAGPFEQLVPGFYRVVWEVSGSGGTGDLEYQVTGAAGSRTIGALTTPLPEGRQVMSMPLRITASSPGWDLEFPVINRGNAPVRVESVRVENDPEAQLRWWLEELKQAMGDRRPS